MYRARAAAAVAVAIPMSGCHDESVPGRSVPQRLERSLPSGGSDDRSHPTGVISDPREERRDVIREPHSPATDNVRDDDDASDDAEDDGTLLNAVCNCCEEVCGNGNDDDEGDETVGDAGDFRRGRPRRGSAQGGTIDVAVSGEPPSPLPLARRGRNPLQRMRIRRAQLSLLLPAWCPSWLVTGLTMVPLFTELCGEFGYRAIGIFAAVYFLVKGIMVHIVGAVQLPLYKDVFLVDNIAYQRLSSVTLTAWGVKPAIGLISDAFPIWGYHKKYYMLASCVVCVVCIIAVLFLPSTPSGGTMAAVALFLVNLGMAAVDLLAEGTYSRLLRSNRRVGPALVSFVWGCAMAGGTVAATFEGPLADAGAPRLALLLAAPIAAITAVPIFYNWLGEARATWTNVPSTSGGATPLHSVVPRGEAEDVTERSGPTDDHALKDAHDDDGDGEDDGLAPVLVKKSLQVPCFRNVSLSLYINPKVLRNWKVAAYGLGVALGAVVLAFTGTYSSGVMPQLVTGSTVTVTLAALSFVALPTPIAKANVFMFLKELCYVQIPGVLDYFYTTDDACLPGGPHFSYSYYQTFTGIVGYVAGGLGVAAFNMWLSDKSLRSVFWSTTALKILASLFDLIMVARWNITVLAIPDYAMFMLGDAVVGQVCSMLDFMPAVILISRMCPRGMEATVYAVLAGFSNFGQTMSRILGLMLTQSLGVVADVTQPAASTSVPGDGIPALTTLPPPPGKCDWTNAPLLIFICHCLMPLLVFPLAVFLVPNMRANDDQEGDAARGTKPRATSLVTEAAVAVSVSAGQR